MLRTLGHGEQWSVPHKLSTSPSDVQIRCWMSAIKTSITVDDRGYATLYAGGAAFAQEHININHGVGKQSKEKIIKNPAIR